VVVEFGAGGPQVRVVVGDPDQAPPPPAIRSGAPLTRLVLLAAAIAIAIATLMIWVAWGG
jgi:hypothetical protein